MKSFPIYLYIFIILGSCSSPVKRDSLKPQSVGNLAELVVLSNFNDEEYKGVVNQIFQKSLDGYPPPGESSFYLR